VTLREGWPPHNRTRHSPSSLRAPVVLFSTSTPHPPPLVPSTTFTYSPSLLPLHAMRTRDAAEERDKHVPHPLEFCGKGLSPFTSVCHFVTVLVLCGTPQRMRGTTSPRWRSSDAGITGPYWPTAEEMSVRAIIPNCGRPCMLLDDVMARCNEVLCMLYRAGGVTLDESRDMSFSQE